MSEFRRTYTAMPAGCDQQGRYRTRRQAHGDLYRRAPLDEVIPRHRNGQPIAGEAVAEPDDDGDIHDPARGILNTIAIVGVCVLLALLLAHWGSA